MSTPMFSVVIPTRERAATLRHCLATCLAQDFDDYEVVVCDNCSSEATRVVVEATRSPRVRYHRSATPLSMQDNWNLAYSLTRGQYVLFIGDDDGLMPFALREVDSILRRHGVAALCWDWAIYTWPNIAVPEDANYLRLPSCRSVRVLDSRQTLIDVLGERCSANLLPNVYHSAVARTVLESVRNRAGVVFRGWYPDTFTSFAVTYLLDSHAVVSAPMSVIGLSGSSNYVAGIKKRNKHATAESFRADNARANIRLHPVVPDLPLICAVQADSFLQAKEALFPNDNRFVLDRRQLIDRCLRDLAPETEEERGMMIEVIRQSLHDDPQLLTWFEAKVAAEPPPIRLPPPIRQTRHGYDIDCHHLDTSLFHVEDVAGAVRLATNLLGIDRGTIDYDLVCRADERAQFTTALQQSLARIGQLEQEGALRNLPRRLVRKMFNIGSSLLRTAT